MNINELDSFRLSDAVKFNDTLNPRLWDKQEKLKPEIRDRLLEIADDFREFLGVTDLQLKDITISGSNAAYTYTPHSDIDLHLVVDLPEADQNEVYRELFDAKKYQYNDVHNIKIGGHDVELYVENANKKPVSQGIYSVLNDQWVDIPQRKKANVDDVSTRNKYNDLSQRIDSAIRSGDRTQIETLSNKIKEMRQTGLDQHGEFGPENLAFKMLRTQGKIKDLYDARNAAKDELLSLDERKKKRKKKVRYGYGGYWYPGTAYAGQDHPAGTEGGDGGGDGGESIKESTETDEDILKDFINFCAKELKIEQLPIVKLRRDPQWSVVNKTFGRYNNDKEMLEVAFGQRHIMDVLRTVAHELTHRQQHEREAVPGDAGETGSPYENEANARAGVLMRDYAGLHPEYFESGQAEEIHSDEVEESLKGKLGALATAACVAGAPGCASTGQALRTTQDVGRTVQTVKNMSSAGVKDELSQELRNFIRAQKGEPGSQNQSQLYQLQKRMTQNESASGYIPTKKQAKDPRWSMALTQDIKPGQLGKEANKLNLKTDKQGHPQVAKASGLFEKLALEFSKFKNTDEDYSPDNPPGPEFKPTMPKGTVKVDVSDIYDWYKLGQHISNMDGLGKHDFGKGPPASIISFGDENTEHKFIDNLKKTGLDVTDIDPVDPKQPGGMRKIKTDPTYNVDEVINTPVNKSKDAEQYYKFIMAKHKLGRALTRQEQEYVRAHQMLRQQVAENVQLDEVRMSPSNLQQWARSPAAEGIRAGFEAELIFRDTNSGDDDDSDMEPDYDMDERCRSIDQVVEFFQDDEYGYGLSERNARQLQESLDEKYMEWMDEKMYDSWRDERDELIKEAWLRDKPMSERIHAALVDGLDLTDEQADAVERLAADREAGKIKGSDMSEEQLDMISQYSEARSIADDILEEDVEQTIEKEDGFYDEVLDDFRSDFYVDDDSSFFGDIGLRYMSDVSNEYDLGWPYLTGGAGNGGSRDWESIGDSLHDTIDMPVKVSSGYHSATRKEGLWIVEPDSSLQPDDREDYGLEIVSPPMPLLTALEKLQEVTDWANDTTEGDAYTNSSTGLHMGVSVPFKGGDVDYLKLVLFLGDEYVLKQFGREANTYTKSAMSKFKENIKGGRTDPMSVIKLMQHGLLELAQREVQKGVGEGKYTSVHVQKGYIEFRSAGGDWLAEESADPEKLSSTMLRYARAMSIAANPGEERREYAKKLYKLIAPEGDSQLALFSQFAAGELTAEQLKKKWAEKTIGTEKKMNQRWRLYQNVDGRWEPVPGAEWNGYSEDQVKTAVWSKYGREALDSGEYQLVNMGEQSWEVYDVNSGETLEIVKGKSKGEVADAVYDKYVDQGIGFQVRPYTDPATLTPRAKLAKRISDAPKEQPQLWQVVNKKTGEVYDTVEGTKSGLGSVLRNFEKAQNIPQGDAVLKLAPVQPEQTVDNYRGKWEFFYAPTGRVLDAVNDASIMQARAVLADTQRRYNDLPADQIQMRKAGAVQDVEPDVAQNFAAPQDATDVPRNWEFVNRINGQVIHTMTNASYNQANVVQDNLESRYPDADIYLRSVANLEENFADGKNPQDKGDSVRHGIPKGATIAQLEKAAKAPGRKGQLARWQLNMRRGKKK